MQRATVLKFSALILVLAACGQTPAAATTAPPAATLAPTRTPAPTATTAPIVDGGVIAFSSRRPGVVGIYVANADGSGEPVLISAHATGDSKPTWSPDGSQIAFESLRDDVAAQENLDIYVVKADGTQLRRLTTDAATDGQPVWSPDGEQIAFTSNRDGNFEVYVMDADGKNARNLSQNPEADGAANWAPDGKSLLFASLRDGNYAIYRVNLDGSDLMQLTDPEIGGNSEPSYSPDGSRILFTSNRDGNLELYVMNSDGSQQQRLTDDPADDQQASWSPSGNSIVFSSTRTADGIPDIYIMKADGSEVRPFAPAADFDGYPVWSATAQISEEPVFGPGFCMRDSNQDFAPDQVTNTFTSEDLFPYVAFLYRNMEPDLMWSVEWNYSGAGLDFTNVGMHWENGPEGLYVSAPGGSTLPSGETSTVTVNLVLEDVVMQTITCEIARP